MVPEYIPPEICAPEERKLVERTSGLRRSIDDDKGACAWFTFVNTSHKRATMTMRFYRFLRVDLPEFRQV